MSLTQTRFAPGDHARPENYAGRTRILIVDDESIVRELLVRKLSSQGYLCDTCENGMQALECLRSRNYELMLTDIQMPSMNGTELMRQALALVPDLAVILVTSVTDLETAVDSLRDGAYDYIFKPFSLEQLSISVARALEKRQLLLENREYQRTLEDQVANRTRQVRDALETLNHTYHSTLLALGTALDSRDSGLDGHALRVTLYAKRLAVQVGVSGPDLRVIEQGALLHDIGKIGVPDELLRRPGKLTPSEWELMKKHPEIGYRILSGIPFLHEASRVVFQHQEKYDGTGYPGGLRGEEICLGARIFAVVDTLDCMTTDRPFQKATTFEAACAEIVRVAGTQLDPAIVEKFLEIPLDEWKEIHAHVECTLDSP